MVSRLFSFRGRKRHISLYMEYTFNENVQNDRQTWNIIKQKWFNLKCKFVAVAFRTWWNGAWHYKNQDTLIWDVMLSLQIGYYVISKNKKKNK